MSAHLIDFDATRDPSGRWDYFADFDVVACSVSGEAASATDAWMAICAAMTAPRVMMAQFMNEERE
jgi:hypothetical protein